MSHDLLIMTLLKKKTQHLLNPFLQDEPVNTKINYFSDKKVIDRPLSLFSFFFR
jgi:hypothetical protein